MSLKKVSWAISLGFLASSFGSSNEQDRYLICSNGYCLTKGYNSADPPKPSEVGPLRIGVEIKLNQIIDARDHEFSVGLSCYLSVSWQEPRLFYLDSGNLSDSVSSFNSNLDSAMTEKLWLPDLYVYHLRKIRAPSLFKPFSGN